MANIAPVMEPTPVGFGFRPTDEELVAHYLTNKLKGDNSVLQIIPEIEVCKYEPCELPGYSIIKSNDLEWFFFSPCDYKYSKSPRYNRTTRGGFWKATGADRKIKVRGSNELIGEKKTLVFYTGRVPNAVKTNWVMHEYHAVAFPDDQRTFVLCKLIKKFEKTEERTELIADEGEPSYMPSDCELVANEGRIQDVQSWPQDNMESIFQTQHSGDEPDLSFLLPLTPIVNENEFSSAFPPSFNSHTGNDSNSLNLPFECTEEEEDFVNSIIVGDKEITVDDEEEAFLCRRVIGSINSINFSEPIDAYWQSSDTDAEVVSAQPGYIPYDSIKFCKRDGPSEILQISEVNSSELSSNQVAKQEKEGRSFQYDMDSSSGDSVPARPLKINRTKNVSSASTSRTWKTQYQPRSAESVSMRAGARKSQTHRKVSTKETYHEAQKGTQVNSNKNKKAAQLTDKRNTSKSPSSESSGVKGRNFFIQMETPSSSSQNHSPPSVYLCNVVVALFLFVIVIWEMLSYGKFC